MGEFESDSIIDAGNTGDREARGRLVRDIVIIFIFLLVTSYLVERLFHTLKNETNSYSEPVGIVSEVDNNVRRRLERRLVWESISQNSNIYNGDIVRTGVFSQVTLDLNNGDKIKLNENSMVLISIMRTGSRFDLLNGFLSVHSQAGSVVVANGYEFKLKEGSNVTVHEETNGKFIVENAKDEIFDEETAPIPVSPVHGEVLSFRGTQPYVRFRWKEPERTANESYNSFYIEVADNKKFANPVLSKIVRGNSILCGDLDAGDWYWRITPEQAQWQGEAQEIHFFIRDDSGVEGAVPAETAILLESVIDKEKNPLSVFRPELPSPAAAGYFLELKSPESQNVVRINLEEQTEVLRQTANRDLNPEQMPEVPKPNKVIELE
ncbi:MAG: FecR family protein [Spirochaetaceae bacterium]|jgi:hypothetical protein|nr:FecR family protein [Spirochaetaceae bacterium]GMO19256.1 MAG: hypothetical protein Pg6A_05980 [Termitinemataceae bacterium]